MQIFWCMHHTTPAALRGRNGAPWQLHQARVRRVPVEHTATAVLSTSCLAPASSATLHEDRGHQSTLVMMKTCTCCCDRCHVSRIVHSLQAHLPETICSPGTCVAAAAHHGSAARSSSQLSVTVTATLPAHCTQHEIAPGRKRMQLGGATPCEALQRKAINAERYESAGRFHCTT